MSHLFANQKSAIEKLKQYKIGALFMEPGTGKTRTALELIDTITDADYVLWLTPCQTKDNLHDELAKWSSVQVHVHGIESLSSSDALYLQLHTQLSQAICPCIIVDESLKIKNWSAKRTQRIIALGELAQYKLILNGTPISRNILDIWSQMQFLSPRILGMSQTQFKNTYCEWKKRHDKNTGRISEWIVKYYNVDHLYSLIQHYVFEANLQLNLKRQFITINYTIDGETLERYNELKKYYLSSDKLQQLNNNYFIEMTTKMQHSYSTCDAKLKALDDIVRNCNTNNLIVFCKYTSSVDAITKRYNVTVLTYGKHSFGLNMQHINTIVFFDKTWDYAQRLQAERRIFRTGQKRDCIYYDLTGNVGLEKLIDSNIDKKINLLQAFKQSSIKQLSKIL